MNANTSTAQDFTPTGYNLFFPGSNPWPRGIFRVSDEVRRWDGFESRFAVYSEQHDVYSPCRIEITGRKVLWNGSYTLTVRVTFEDEGPTGYAYDGVRHLGKIILADRGDFFTIERAREALTI
jgi:hypothetical protein